MELPSSYLALRRFRGGTLHYKSITPLVMGKGLAKLQALGVGSPPKQAKIA